MLKFRKSTPKAYFEYKAKVYNKERSSGILGKMVSKEKIRILSTLDPSHKENILDIGCGAGYYSIIIKEKGATPFGIDISPKMIEELKKNNIEGCVADVENLQLNKKFDKVFCSGALDFTKSPKAAMKCMSKHTKKGGTFVMYYPRVSIAGYIYKLYHRLHGFNVHIFSRRRIYNLLKENDFSNIEIKRISPLTNVVKARKRQQ
jgi:2-polyprenyl-3-methyl-5-hydroxy-6-metoxy-1,4-benzoquinol methylase